MLMQRDSADHLIHTTDFVIISDTLLLKISMYWQNECHVKLSFHVLIRAILKGAKLIFVC